MAKAKPPQGINITTIRTAELLIERHGDEALKFAEVQAERLERAGSESSAVDWRDVIAAIKKIQEEKKRK
jgi:hypothetical protein